MPETTDRMAVSTSNEVVKMNMMMMMMKMMMMKMIVTRQDTLIFHVQQQMALDWDQVAPTVDTE